MASISSVIDLIFNGIDNASGPIKGISSNLGALDQAAQGIAAPFAGLADSLLKAEAAVLAMGAAVGILAVRETVKFEDSLYLIEKQLRGTNITVDDARLAMEKLALQYGVNANESVRGAAEFLKAGFDYKNSTELIRIALDLMIGGEISATQATRDLLAAIAGWRIPMDQGAEGAQKIADILNKIDDISGGTFEDIASAFSRVSPTAYDAGLSMEKTAAIVARLVDVFREGEIAGQALISGLGHLIRPTKEAAEALAAAGVVTENSNGQQLRAGEILDNVAARWGSLSSTQQQSLAVTVFGIYQYTKLSDVFGNWSKVTDYQNQLLDKQTGAVGSLSREVELKLALVSSSIATANESWRQFLENLGAKITTGNALEDLIKDFGSLGIAFKDVVNQGGFDPLIELLQNQFGDISDLIEAMAQNLPKAFEGLDWSGLIESFQGLQGEVSDIFRAFFGDIDLTTVEGLQSALQTVMNTFEALTITVTGIVSELKPLAAFFGELIRGFNEVDKASQLEFGKFLGQMKLIVDAGTGLGLALIAIGRAGLDMKDVLETAFAGVQTAVNALQTGLGVMALGLTKIWQTALEGSLALYELNPFADDAVIADTKAKIAGVQKFADSLSAGIEKNAQELRDAAGRAGDGLLKMGSSSETARAKLDESEAALRKAGQAAKDAGEEFKALGKAIPVSEWDGAIGALRQFEDETGKIDLGQKLIRPLIDSKKAFDDLDKKISSLEWGDGDGLSIEEPMDKNIKATQVWNEELGKMVTVYDSATTATVKATGAFKAAGDSTQSAKDQLAALTQGGKLTVDQLTEITKAANDFEVKMEEIASNERIKTIELAVQLDIARLETDTERVKAAFASIDNTISSTGELLVSLFGSLTDADTYAALDIREQIDLENKRRQEVLDMQKKLVEAEIARIEAQTRVMERGDPWIKIDGTGLAPQLEAFMWEILKAIRTQVNAEFADFLLGVGLTA